MSEQMVMGLNPTDDFDYNTNTPLFNNKDRIVNLVLQSYNLAKYIELQLVGNMLQMVGKKDKQLIAEVSLGSIGKLIGVDYNPTANSLIFDVIDDNGVQTQEVINLNELNLYTAGNAIEIEGGAEDSKKIDIKYADGGYLTINTLNQLDTSEKLQTVLDSKIEGVVGVDAIQAEFDMVNNSFDIMLAIDDTIDKGNVELAQTNNGLSADISFDLSYDNTTNTLSLFAGDMTLPSAEVVITTTEEEYTAGDGIEVENDIISLKIDEVLTEGDYLKVGDNGLYISNLNLNAKVDKIDGKELSTNDFSDEDKDKLYSYDDELSNLSTQINGKVDKSLYDIKIKELESEINKSITNITVGNGIAMTQLDHVVNLDIKISDTETNLRLNEMGLSTNLPDNLMDIITSIQVAQLDLVKSIQQLNNTIANQSIMIDNLTKRVTALEEK